MRAIETSYNGYRFRSRLEARWAVFYDTLGVSYKYEPEGFDLDGTWYLPDFWLPEQDCWVEIKPEPPTEAESVKAELLCIATKKTVFIFYPDVWFAPSRGEWPAAGFEPHGPAEAWFYVSDDERRQLGETGPEADIPAAAWDETYCWCECTRCGKFGIQYMGRAARICRHGDSDKDYNSDSPRLLTAYAAARSARFEHQAKP